VDGPLLQSARAKAGQMQLRFAQAPGGLRLRAGSGAQLLGFAIAGADQHFVPAQARLKGMQVLLHHPDVPQPVAVRYGWVDNPEQANLVDAQGLPAQPFRTDAWPLLTEGVRFSP